MAPNLYAEFVWKDKEAGAERREVKQIGFITDAIKCGTDKLALYFRTFESNAPDGPRSRISGRNFTNVQELALPSGTASYIERRKGLSDTELKESFRRLDIERGKCKTSDDLIDLYQNKPAESRFVAPGYDGFINMEKGDRAFDAAGQQIWPPKVLPESIAKPKRT